MVADINDSHLLICYRCGAWCTRKLVGLAKPCTGVQTAAGALALRKVGSGFSPVGGFPIAGLWSLRDSVVKHCHNPWLPAGQTGDLSPAEKRLFDMRARLRSRMGLG